MSGRFEPQWDMLRPTLFSLVLAATLTASGCGIGAGGVAEKDGTYLLLAPKHISEAGYGFIASKLVLVGECVGLKFGGQTDPAVVIWPHGTDLVSTSPLVIDVPGLGRVREGQSLSGGGADYRGAHPLRGVTVPSGCRHSRLVSFSPE